MAWLLGSASNCGSVWFTVRKRWKRSANNRLGNLEISSSGDEDSSLIQLRSREAMGIRFKEPKLPSTPCVSFTQTVTCDCFLRMIGPPRTRYSLLDTSYGLLSTFLAVSRYGEPCAQETSLLLVEKKRKKKKELITGWVHDLIRNVVSWLALSMNLDVRSIRGGSVSARRHVTLETR